VATPPLNIVGWAQIDQLGRLMAGAPLSKEDANLPTRLFTSDTIGAEGADLFPELKNFRTGFMKSWGL
jgi:hypothetical protein